jgi:hypothetical protein
VSDDNRKGDWFQTFKGRKVWPLDPRPGDADLDEIIHALSNICRFNGHVPVFYSVAQHSVLVSRCVAEVWPNKNWPYLALEGLFHDAPEAYLGDVIRPLKRSGALTGGYFEAEVEWGRVIAEMIGLDPSRLASIDPAVKVADDRLLLAERRDLMPNPERRDEWREIAYEPYAKKIIPVPPVEAEAMFRAEYEKLKGGSR